MDKYKVLLRESRTYFVVTAVLLVVLYAYAAVPPPEFPSGSIVEVEQGAGLYELAEELRDDGVIRSPFWFRTAAILLGGERAMQAGQYYLPYPQSTFAIAWRVVHGDSKLATVRVTIPEGFTAKKIAELMEGEFPFFDSTAFLSTAPEGYLFPDTYFISRGATASSTISMLRDNFIRKIFPLMPEVEMSGHTLEEILTMASIIEGEAATKADREIVSGILWKRLEMGMPLQVDASFVYFLGKSTAELTKDDLAIDSPYNTYKYPGLPPTPIGNPGLESIEAALRPSASPYLYFLTAPDGTMHYSETHDEHVEKKQKYLR